MFRIYGREVYMNRKICFAALTAALALSALLFNACGLRDHYSSSYVTETAAAAAPYGASGIMTADEMAYDYADLSSEAMSYNGGMTGGMAAKAASAAYEADDGTGISESEITNAAEGQAAERDASRKLIRNAFVSAQTMDYDVVRDRLKSDITALGGYIESMDEYSGGYYNNNSRSCNITARLPQDKLDYFMNTSFEDTAIISKNESTEDITLRYSDLSSHLTVLRTEQERLTELLAEADSIEAVIALESRLSEVRYQIESIEQSLRSYDNRVTYSTLNIDLAEVSRIEPAAEAGFAERVLSGLSEKTENMIIFMIDALIFLITSIPVFMVAALIIFGIYRLIRLLSCVFKAGAASKKSRAADTAAAAASKVNALAKAETEPEAVPVKAANEAVHDTAPDTAEADTAGVKKDQDTVKEAKEPEASTSEKSDSPDTAGKQ